jgi:hypothetical protein
MDVVDQLKKSGMPVALISDAIKEVIPKEYQKKMADLKAAVMDMQTAKRQYSIFLITGEDSPSKDSFCAAFMKWYMVTRNKTGRWCLEPTEYDPTIGGVGVTLFTATYLYSPQAAKWVATAIREKVSLGRVFILCSPTKESFEKTFGKIFMSYISHLSVYIELKTNPIEIPVI